MTVKEYLKDKIDAEILLYYKDASKYPQELYDQLQIRWGVDEVVERLGKSLDRALAGPRA